MKVRFYDRQDTHNSANGTVLEGSAELRSLLEQALDRPAFFVELIGDNGYQLLLGLGPHWGCAQFSASDGDPPYLMALAANAESQEGELEFLIGNTETPIPRRYCVPRATAIEIAAAFVETGKRKADVVWEEI